MLPGPTLFVDCECRWQDIYLTIPQHTPLLEQIGALLAIYYLLQRNYPSSYGQLLGVLQEGILAHNFPYKGKKCRAFLSSLPDPHL
jgi:hypothetical protein